MISNQVSISHLVATSIVALPLLGFFGLLFFGKRLRGNTAGWIALGTSTLSFLATLLIFVQVHHSHHERLAIVKLFEWIGVGPFHVDAALRFDALSLTMALFVTGVGSLIHLYSVGYMAGDARYSRFFVYLNLFLASMLVLVLGNNFLMTFVGWEGVGTCSYLLISFWFERPAAASAGKKAFIVNRIGDFGFLIATFLIVSKIGVHSSHPLDFDVVLSQSLPLLKSSATAICLLFFLGACGKSAQLPLSIWLPDAMEGPIPVSALIHAATMVTAGVYLMVRIAPLLVFSTSALTTIAVVGAITALFAATAAVAQNDIKRVLAYSTISQLGYMFLAVGSGAYTAAIYHMITHAFFKALLFLGAGSAIHGLHEEQDMKRMGGLRKWMPVTAFTFLIGWLAIAGVPPFAGFWSKDDILHAAYGKSHLLWAIGLFTALLTAYYMTRQIVLVFFGGERFRKVTTDKHDINEHTAQEAHHGAHGDNPHESPWTMTAPLIVLAVLSLVGGLINLPFGPKLALEHWLGAIVPQAPEIAVSTLRLAVIATVVALAGILISFVLWRKATEHRSLEPVFLKKAWGLDALYRLIVEKPGVLLANFSAYIFDRKIIDGIVNGAGITVEHVGSVLRRAQTGYVRTYALAILAGTVVLLGYGIVRAYS